MAGAGEVRAPAFPYESEERFVARLQREVQPHFSDEVRRLRQQRGGNRGETYALLGHLAG